MFGVSVLLEEVFLDEGADVEGDLVWVREGGFPNELDDLVQFFAVGESGRRKTGLGLLRMWVERWGEEKHTAA